MRDDFGAESDAIAPGRDSRFAHPAHENRFGLGGPQHLGQRAGVGLVFGGCLPKQFRIVGERESTKLDFVAETRGTLAFGDQVDLVGRGRVAVGGSGSEVGDGAQGSTGDDVAPEHPLEALAQGDGLGRVPSHLDRESGLVLFQASGKGRFSNQDAVEINIGTGYVGIHGDNLGGSFGDRCATTKQSKRSGGNQSKGGIFHGECFLPPRWEADRILKGDEQSSSRMYSLPGNSSISVLEHRERELAYRGKLRIPRRFRGEYAFPFEDGMFGGSEEGMAITSST